MNVDVDIDDWHSVEKLLSDWYHQACINRDKNARKAQFNKKLHYWLGIPVVIFSSIVGSAAFTQINEAGSNKVRIIAGVLSIVSAILAGLQTFFGFGESAEKYRVVGIGYEQVAKDIEKIQALPVHLRGAVGEETKAGASESELPEIVERVAACEHLSLTGLMTLPPFFEDAERVRPFFRRLRQLRDRYKARGHFGDASGELSMGMSNDFEVAIEEGATMVRVGTAIFGERGKR